MGWGDLGNLLRQLEERSRDPVHRIAGPGAFVPGHKSLETRTVKDDSGNTPAPIDSGGLGVSFAGASVFLFQLLIGFALTNGAYAFFTAGSSGLRSLSSFGVVESLLFGIFVVAATLRVLDFTAAMPHNSVVYYPHRGGSVLFLVDSFLGIGDALLFYVLSLTLGQARTDPIPFYYTFAAILLLEIFWTALSAIMSNYRRRRQIIEILLSAAALGVGTMLIIFQVSYLNDLLLAIIVLRVAMDFIVSQDLFRVLRGSRH